MNLNATNLNSLQIQKWKSRIKNASKIEYSLNEDLMNILAYIIMYNRLKFQEICQKYFIYLLYSYWNFIV